MDDELARAMAKYVAEAASRALVLAPPGYRLVCTYIADSDPASNTVKIVSEWELDP